MNTKKAQGGLEYLLLIGGAVVMAAVILMLMAGITSQGKQTTTSRASDAFCAPLDQISCTSRLGDQDNDGTSDCIWDTTLGRCTAGASLSGGGAGAGAGGQGGFRNGGGQGNESATLEITVKEGITGIANASIQITGPNNFSITRTTNANGVATFDVAQSGLTESSIYDVTVSATGYETATQKVSIGPQTTLLAIQLTSASAQTSCGNNTCETNENNTNCARDCQPATPQEILFAVKLVNKNNENVLNAVVVLKQNGQEIDRQTTGPVNYAEFSEVDPGTYDLEITAEGYVTKTVSVKVESQPDPPNYYETEIQLELICTTLSTKTECENQANVCHWDSTNAVCQEGANCSQISQQTKCDKRTDCTWQNSCVGKARLAIVIKEGTNAPSKPIKVILSKGATKLSQMETDSEGKVIFNNDLISGDTLDYKISLREKDHVPKEERITVLTPGLNTKEIQVQTIAQLCASIQVKDECNSIPDYDGDGITECVSLWPNWTCREHAQLTLTVTQNNRPVEGTIDILQGTELTSAAGTNPQGIAVFDEVGAQVSEYTLKLRDGTTMESPAAHTQPLQVLNRGQNQGTFEIPASTQGNLPVNVKNYNGAVMSDATVTLKKGANTLATAQTDSSGNVNFNLAFGSNSFYIYANKGNYQPQRKYYGTFVYATSTPQETLKLYSKCNDSWRNQTVCEGKNAPGQRSDPCIWAKWNNGITNQCVDPTCKTIQDNPPQAASNSNPTDIYLCNTQDCKDRCTALAYCKVGLYGTRQSQGQTTNQYICT